MVSFLVKKLDVLSAGFRRDFEIQHFSIFDPSFDDGLIGSVEFEGGVPFFWPGGKKNDFLTIRLHEHVLQSREDHGSLALVGNPIEVWAPEGREAAIRAVRFFIGAAHEILCGDSLDEIGLRLLCQTEQGGLNRILLPTTCAFVIAPRK